MNNEEHQFKNIDGSLYYFQGDTIIYGPSANEALSFAFDVKLGCLKHHGSASKVDEYVKLARKTINDACSYSKEHPSFINLLNPFNEPLKDIVIVTVSAPFEGEGAWDVELINKFIQNTGFIGLWYRRMLAEQERASKENNALVRDEGMSL